MTAICFRNSSSFGDPGIRGDSSSGLCHLSRDPVVSNPRTSLELFCSSLFPALSSPVSGAFCKTVASSGDLVHTAGGTSSVVSNPRTSLELFCSSLFPALSSPVSGAFCKTVASSGDLVHTAGGTRLAILLGPASDDPQNWIGLAAYVIGSWLTAS